MPKSPGSFRFARRWPVRSTIQEKGGVNGMEHREQDLTQYKAPPVLCRYRGKIPLRWGQDLITLLPKANGEYCLDFGCGSGGAQQLIQEHGHRWIGIDISGDKVSVRSDGHHLPFKDETFATAVSIAVFEHLYDPFSAARQIYRVLKPGGILLGDVAFLEPFHANSYFHMTHLGIREVLLGAGFHVLRLWPTRHLLEAEIELCLPVRIPLVFPLFAGGARLLARGIMGIRSLGLRLYLSANGRSVAEIKRRLEFDRLTWTGSIGFLAQKQE
jgi:SAM-dependent methyltransferase